jgi:Fur family ferric uptake transcriptional regulator
MNLPKKKANGLFESYLHDRGLRLTGRRRMILHQVLSEQEHFEAEELYEKCREKASHASRATVYRTLRILQSCGIIQETKRTDRGVEYEVIYGREHHDHLFCLGCGRIIEFTCPAIEVLQKQVCQKQGFEQTGHHHEITGYCSQCQRKRRRT